MLRPMVMLCRIDSIMRNIFHIQYAYEEYSRIGDILHNIPHIQYEFEEYFAKYCRSHITLFWVWIMLC